MILRSCTSCLHRKVGKGKCSALEAKQANVTKGKAKCTYLYDYADKNWQKYKYSAYCAPPQVVVYTTVKQEKAHQSTHTGDEVDRQSCRLVFGLQTLQKCWFQRMAPFEPLCHIAAYYGLLLLTLLHKPATCFYSTCSN